MRAKEFISEDKQKLDEIAPLAVGLYLATAGLTAYEMKSIYDDYKSGKITGPEALKKAGIQAGAAALGGLAGKVASKVPAVVGAVAKPVKDIAKKVVDKVKSKPDAKTTKPKPRGFQYKNYREIIPQGSEGSPPPTSSEPSRKDNFHSRVRNQHIERKELTRTLRELNAPNSGVELNQFTDFTIMPGTRLQLDNFTLSSMTRNKAKSIAKAIELTLLQNLKFNKGE